MSKYDIHPSEWKWIDTNDKFDSILYNNGTIEDLKNQVLNHLA